MSAALAQAVYDRCVSDTSSGSFYDKVSGNIYLEQGPQNVGPPASPLAVIQVAGSEVERTFSDKAGHKLDCSILIFFPRSSGASSVLSADDALFSLCSGHRATSVSGFDAATFVCRTRGQITYYADAIGVASEWTVTGFTT